MSLRSSSQRPVATQQQAALGAGGGPARPPAKALQLSRWQQEQTQWCWAACAGAVAAYYSSSSTWTQCALVCAELGQQACCGSGDSGMCNQAWFLDRALTRVGHFDAPRVDKELTWDQLVSEILTNQPVGVRIGWSTGGGHFVLIAAYDESGMTKMLDVEDPWEGQRMIAYDKLLTAYPGDGRWTHSYLTKA